MADVQQYRPVRPTGWRCESFFAVFNVSGLDAVSGQWIEPLSRQRRMSCLNLESEFLLLPLVNHIFHTAVCQAMSVIDQAIVWLHQPQADLIEEIGEVSVIPVTDRSIVD